MATTSSGGGGDGGDSDKEARVVKEAQNLGFNNIYIWYCILIFEGRAVSRDLPLDPCLEPCGFWLRKLDWKLGKGTQLSRLKRAKEVKQKHIIRLHFVCRKSKDSISIKFCFWFELRLLISETWLWKAVATRVPQLNKDKKARNKRLEYVDNKVKEMFSHPEYKQIVDHCKFSQFN